MLRTIYLALIFILLLASCKKEQLPVSQPKTPAKEFSSNDTYALDSTLIFKKNKTLLPIYRKVGYKTLWTNVADRKAIINFIADIESDGLQPKDYNYKKINGFESGKKSKADCINYDILLSESFCKLTSHLFKGKLSPNQVYPDWDLDSKKIDTQKLLDEAIKNHTISEVLNRCRPTHPIYAGLRKSYKTIAALPDDKNFPKIPYNDIIKLNDSNVILPAIKQRLVYWQDLKEDSSGLIYDGATRKAIKKFQARHGIYNDGIINSKTVEALNVSKQKRLEQITVNLERWKWFAYDFGKRAVIINIPDFWLTVIENNRDTIDSYKIIVGKPERRTPVLMSMFNFLSVNPTWTVPPTILKEDLVPSAIKDREYFAKHNMKIYDWQKNEILPEDWIPETPDQYYYVQGPGPDNSLGEIKFNFQNSHSVYLHDTNHRNNFSRANRALSSGCVRVQNPLKLAAYILEKEDGKYTKEKLEDLVALKETKNLQLKKSSYVHQLYWTAWMEKGSVQFRPDIYNLDDVLYQKLRK